MAAGSRSSCSPHCFWKAQLGADSNSTPAVSGAFVYTAAEDGYVYCFRKANGEPVWKFKLFNDEHPAGQKVLENFPGM